MKADRTKQDHKIYDRYFFEYVFSWTGLKITISLCAEQEHGTKQWKIQDIYVKSGDKEPTNEMTWETLCLRLAAVICTDPHNGTCWEVARPRADEVLRWIQHRLAGDINYEVQIIN